MELILRQTLEAPLESLMPLPKGVVILFGEDTPETRAAVLSAIEDLDIDAMFGVARPEVFYRDVPVDTLEISRFPQFSSKKASRL